MKQSRMGASHLVVNMPRLPQEAKTERHQGPAHQTLTMPTMHVSVGEYLHGAPVKVVKALPGGTSPPSLIFKVLQSIKGV